MEEPEGTRDSPPPFFFQGMLRSVLFVVVLKKKVLFKKNKKLFAFILKYIKLQFCFFFFEQSSLILGSCIKIFTIYVMEP